MTLPLFPDLLVWDIPLPDGPSPYYLVSWPGCIHIERVRKDDAI